VAVATRAPIAYASTLSYLLLVDTERIVASCGAGTAKADKILMLCTQWNLHPSQVVYVGDLPEDQQIANAAGCRFASAAELHDGSLARRFTGTIDLHPGDDATLLALHGRSGISPSEKAALAFIRLQMNPGTRTRRALQRELLINFHPSMRRCVLESDGGLFQLSRRLVTNAELQTDGSLWLEYRVGLGRLFPLAQHLLPNPPSRAIPVKYFAHYTQYGEQLRVAKHYGHHGAGRGSTFHSGPEIELYRIDLISDIMVSVVPAAGPALVPVPSSPPTLARPGEVSRRLARSMAELSGRPFCDLLAKADSGTMTYIGSDDSPRDVVLVDDQLTQGSSLRQAANLLIAEGHSVVGCYVFSVRDQTIGAGNPAVAYPDCPFHGVAQEVGYDCPCSR